MGNRLHRNNKWRKQPYQETLPTFKEEVKPEEEVPDEISFTEEESLPRRKPKKNSYRNNPPKRNPFVNQMSIKKYNPPKYL